MTKLKIREIVRYARPYSDKLEEIDGYKNHFYITSFPGSNSALLERGINPIGSINAVDGKRTPAILIRSSPHKIGTKATPWQDLFDVDNGYIRYFGDNKMPGNDPAASPGNKALLSAYEIYNDPTRRHQSTPLIFYRSVPRNSRAKGFLEFDGYGIIKGVELVTQYDRNLDRTFSNFVFGFQVFSLKTESEEFDWEWINDRRIAKLTTKETEAHAPAGWKDWIKNGSKTLESNRRRVSKLSTLTKIQQIPMPNSPEHRVLKELYKYYSSKK